MPPSAAYRTETRLQPATATDRPTTLGIVWGETDQELAEGSSTCDVGVAFSFVALVRIPSPVARLSCCLSIFPGTRSIACPRVYLSISVDVHLLAYRSVTRSPRLGVVTTAAATSV
ncbi:unnamed protein product [Schistocephalus solidus]|uniref:Uncharacterized protein n=1 Tax=Schistocephalus solidus TaxID=70667 RepID=A0A183SPC1_SCHSO|nr:unnamed protein product [Schistocephalus solidus]